MKSVKGLFARKGWVALAALAMGLTTEAQVTIDLNPAKRGATFDKRHYGIFYEEINHAGDGGLYAELIRNRSIEDNVNNPDFWWNVRNSVSSVSTDYPLNDVSKRSMKVVMSDANTGVRNEGWWGIDIVNGRTYKLALWINGGENGYDGNITAQLQNGNGADMGSVVINGPFEKGWKKYEMEITATGNDERGWFALLGDKAGTIYYDFVSLFPPTYKGRENGCRIDLAEKLEALHPAFMRFPGGCYIEGRHSADRPGQNRFEWKKTIGPIEERPGHFNNNWFYECTDGLGFHEMLQLSEDLGAEPMFVVNMGFGHEWEDDIANINVYIQEALDAIEYCNGSVDTEWGRVRALNGHPEPFNLRLLEIGNENYWFGSYSPRYKLFYEAIHAKHPEIFFIANGGYQWGNPWPADVVDDHYYNSPQYFYSQYRMFDKYKRADYKVYVGEYAVTENFGDTGNLNAALSEAVYMFGMERNSDIVIMNSYAPIFTNENNVLWRPDMIRFNSSKSFGTPSYWVQHLMSNNHGTQNIEWEEIDNLKAPYSLALSSWGTAVRYDNIVVKDMEGNILYENDFSEGNLDGWTLERGGNWTVKDGMMAQTNRSMYGKLALLEGQNFGMNYIIELDAIKDSGDEGFLIGFNAQDTKNFAWFNIGGWGNSQHAVEQTLSGEKTFIKGEPGSLTTGKTYKVRIEVRDGGMVRTLLDNTVVVDKAIMPNEQKLYLASNISDESGRLYVKVVNPYAEKQTTRFNMKSGKLTGTGKLHMLTSGSMYDENTMGQPMKVAPTVKDITVDADGFSYDIPAYSLCIFELDITDADAVNEIVDIPYPLVSYSFETDDKLSDDLGGTRYTYNVIGNGQLKSDEEGNGYFFSGTTGYLSLGKAMPQTVLAKLEGDYTISLRLKMDGMSNVDSFCWAWALAGGTSNFMGFINGPGNNDWYYEMVKSGNGNRVNTGSGLHFGTWNEVVVTCKEGVTSVYMNGHLISSSDKLTVAPSSIAKNITAAYLGKSPFGGDKLLSNTCYDDFKIFDVAFSAEQIKALFQDRVNMSVGISQPVVSTPGSKIIYDMNGRTVTESHRGLAIVDGKKILKK